MGQNPSLRRARQTCEGKDLSPFTFPATYAGPHSDLQGGLHAAGRARTKRQDLRLRRALSRRTASASSDTLTQGRPLPSFREREMRSRGPGCFPHFPKGAARRLNHPKLSLAPSLSGPHSEFLCIQMPTPMVTKIRLIGTFFITESKNGKTRFGTAITHTMICIRTGLRQSRHKRFFPYFDGPESNGPE